MDQANTLRDEASRWVAETQDAHFPTDIGAQRQLRLWLAESELHPLAFMRARRTFDRLKCLRAHPEIDVDRQVQIHRGYLPSSTCRSQTTRWLSVAAALAFGLCLLPRPLDAAPTRYATRLGEQRTVILDEDVQITLSSKTSILVHGEGRYREIDFD